jgi:hypothetical protein
LNTDSATLGRERPSEPVTATSAGRRAEPWAPAALWTLGAFLWLSFLWNMPNAPAVLAPGFFLKIALEAALIAGLIAALPWIRGGRGGTLYRHGIALVTLLVVTDCLTDFGIRAVLDRPFAPLQDLHILPAIQHLLTGSLKGPIALLLVGAVLVAAWIVYGSTIRAVRRLQRAAGEARTRAWLLGVAGLALLLFALDRLTPFEGPVQAQASAAIGEQLAYGRTLKAGLAEFERKLADDPLKDLPPDHLLTRLGDTDVLLVFFESYGRSALERPLFAERIRPRLEAAGEALAAKGLAVATGYLTSPIMGGQSWLAHGTLESGLTLAHQRFSERLLASDRLTLSKAFAKAGHRTLAVKPAISGPWPESTFFGFDRVYGAADLGYRGLPYNWVTMPDQYTFAAFEREERSSPERPPVFAEFSLIGSHAPWTHIPPLVEDWTSIGDGALFAEWAGQGDPPAVVWRDPARILEQYTRSLEHVLGVLESYAQGFVDENTLMIVVGDHQPAPIFAGLDAGRDVPIHVITGNPALLNPFLKWGLEGGILPGAAPVVHRMDEFRDWFLRAFSD